MTFSTTKRKLAVFLTVSLCTFYAITTAKAQKPTISYNQSSFSYTKGISIAGFAAPTNGGGSVPATIRGGVAESIGIGTYNAMKIAKYGNNNMVSLLMLDTTNIVQKVDLGLKAVTKTLYKRDKPISIVKDSQGNVYWTEAGSFKIVANPNQNDEISYASGALEIASELDLPVIGDALEVYNLAKDMYSLFSGGGDMLRDISGKDAPPKYILRFSGKIYKMGPNDSTPTIFMENMQLPTGLAIDANDNLYVTCFTANFTVKGGLSFSGGQVEVVDDETGTYNSKIIKITPQKQVTDIGTYPNINYPTHLGIDNQGNLTMMYSYGDKLEYTGIASIRKYPVGQTTGNTYQSANFLTRGGTLPSQNLPIYQDMVVDGAGNIYLSEFYENKITMLPADGSAAQTFSTQAKAPAAMYVDLSTNQLWVKEGQYTTNATIKKLNLYGYSILPDLPQGLSLNTNGSISGTASVISNLKSYEVTATNSSGFGKTTFSLQISQIAAPNISYATNTYNLPIGQAATIPTANNSGGSFNQQIGPVKTTTVYKGGTKMQGFAFDNFGNSYFAQPDSNRIMKIDASGRSSIYLSGLNDPREIAVDRNTGVLYFSEGKGLKASGVFPGFSTPTLLITGSVIGLAVDPATGNVYLANQGTGTIDRFNTKISTVTNNLISGLNAPTYIAIYDGYLYIANLYGLLQKAPLSNLSNVTTILQMPNPSNKGITFDMAMDDFGNIFLAINDGQIYKIATGTTTAQAFNTSVSAWYTNGLGFDRDNNLYMAPVIHQNPNYNVVKVAMGGYTISPALPAGLTFNTNGTITGIPTAITAVKDYNISATNPLGTSTTTLKIGVNNVPTTNLQYTVPSVLFRGATIASITPTVTGGAPDSFSISPTLPTGLIFNTSTGVISGTPTANKVSATYTVTANNTAGNKTATFNLAVTEIPPASLNYTMASSILQKDIAVNLNPTVTGGMVDIAYSISPSLPAGLSLNTSTGVISGTPTTITPQQNYTITVTNNGGSKQASFNLSVKLDPPTNLAYNISPNLLRDVTITNVTPTYEGAGVSSFSISPALPTGLSFNTTNGVISGKPTVASPATSYTVTASNLGGSTTTTFSLLIRVDAPTNIQYAIASSILRNTALATVTPTYDGSPATSFSISPTLPIGLSFSTTTGAISGTPTAISSATNYTVTATNEGGSNTKTISLAIRVNPASNLEYTISTSYLRDIAIGNITPTYSGNSHALTFSVSPALPNGLNLNTSTGVISGTPTTITAANNYIITASNDGGNATKTFSLAVRVDAPSNLNYNFAHTSLLRNNAIASTTPTYNGSQATSFTVSPGLPAGLNLNPTTGVISGTPTAITPAANYTVTASNDGGSGVTTFSLLVTELAPASMQYTFANSALLRDIAITPVRPAYSGGTATSFSVSPGLPAGLTLNTSTGEISGMPTAISSNTNYTVTASNTAGSTTASFSLSVWVQAPTNLQYTVAASYLRNTTLTNITPTYTGSSKIANFSISPALPAGLNLNSTTGVISGTPTAISPITNYTVTATNDGGSTSKEFSLAVRVDPVNSLQYTIASSYLRNNAVSNIFPTFSGNSHPVTFSINPALPAGLTLNTTTGTISGTPTTITAANNYTIAATNDGGSETFTFPLAVRVDPPTNIRYDFRDTELQKDLAIFSVTPKYSGSPTSIFSISPALPTGAVFNTSTGQISGTPTVLSPTTSYTVTATNDGGSGTTTFSLSVSRIPTPEISYTTTNYTYTKGTPITSIPTPNNTGVVFPQQRIGEALFTGLNQPTGVATDASGNTYIADYEGGNAKIKILTKGSTELADFVSSGLGTAAAYDLAVDVAGNIYMSSGSVIKKITPNKIITDFATGLGNITGLFIDIDNDLYVADHAFGQVIKFDDCNAVNKTIEITGLNIGATASVPAENPRDIVVDSQKNIYVIQASSLVGKPSTFFMFLYKYYASDNYEKNFRSRILTSVDFSSYMTIDKKNNLYINTDGNSLIILNNYIDKGGRLYSQLTNGKIKGIALDANQNAFYAMTVTGGSTLGKTSQFGYNTNGLPSGLILNEDGTITGTPTTIQAQTNHTVKATNFYGTSNADLKITVVDTIPKFQYAQPNQILTAGVNNLSITPTKLGGPISAYSVSPTQLPTGISFNTTTGTFSGVPTKLQDTISTYVISATNTGGTGKDTVTFKIIDRAPTSLVYPTNYVLYLNKQFKGEIPIASGGAITKWSVSPVLPEGLFIDSLTGIIQGYANVLSSAANYTVKGENSGGFTTATVNITIKDLPPSISYASASKFKFKKDQAITPIPAPSNSGGPITSYNTTGLPNGLTLNTDGTISGTPTQLRSSTDYKVIATNTLWGKDTTTVSIEVISLPPDSIKYQTPITIVRGSAISNITPTYTTNVGDPVQRFSITPDLPQGLTLNPTTGTISGTPANVLNSNAQLYYVTAENGAGKNTARMILILKDLAPAISYNANNIFTKGVDTALMVNSTGGAPEKYTISPALPNGLSLDSLTGRIYGIPTALNTSTQYTITATNYGNSAATASFYISVVDKVPNISYATPHTFIRTVAIDPITVSSTGGENLTYTITPTLPQGLTIDALTGTISGTPTISSVAKDYTITATNTGGTSNMVINLAVKNAAPIISYENTYSLNKNVAVSNIQPTSTGGNQITFSITPALPNGLSLDTETGAISGTPTATAPLTTYTLRAVNDGGEVSSTFTIIVNEKPPGSISYAELTSDFYVGYAITPISPIVENGGGEIANYSIAPTNLAPGLNFNTNTGVISGTPTADYIRTSYIITAHNSGGISQTTVTFAVIKLSASISKTDVKCFGSSTGTATVTVIGGKAPYQYTWSLNGGTTATASALKAGTYTVTIKDANNSTITASVTINEPNLLDITSISKVDNQVNGGTSGSATATVTGGTAPYNYVWSSNSSNTNIATGLDEGSYTLTVTDANNCSTSKTVFIDAPPAMPSNVSAQAGNTKNTITWSPSAETDLASYKIYGGTTSNPTTLLQIITAPISTYTHENLSNGTMYYYRITAVDKGGYESVYASQVTATPQGAQSITFAPLQAKTYGDADFNAGATTNSGLAITYTTDNPLVATIIGDKIHIVGAGTVNITASQNGDGTWLPPASQTQQLTVNKRTLTITATAQDKVYDANRNAAINLSDNRILGDNLTISYASALFNNKNVGTGKMVSVNGINVGGIAANNYNYNTTTTTTADITPKSLTVSATANHKVYDGNTIAEVVLSDNKIVGDIVDLSSASATFNNKNVGIAKAVSIKGITISGADASNYTFNSSTTALANITAKTLVVNATANNKVYDGNTSTSVALTDNRIIGDIITSQYASAVFDNKNVGTAKTVNVNGISISGADAVNYTVNTTISTTANITARNLVVTATGNNKVYDGNLTATVNLSDNRVTGDQLTPTYSFAIFDDKNIGSTKSVAVFGINIAGTDALNYNVNATTNTIAAITTKPLTITADNKTSIQGLALPALTASYSGFVNGEDSNILTAKPMLNTAATNTSPQGTYPINTTGAVAQNYSITYVNGTLTIPPGTPTSIALAQSMVLENQTSGTTVGSLTSTSPDPNASFTYSLVAGNGSADNSKFSIQGNSVRTLASFDYESQSSFNIRVRTTTQYGASLEQAFIINLTDVNEAPTLADINNQTICFTSAQQNVSLTGITPGPETAQNTIVTVSSNNNNLFSSLNAGNVSNGNASLNYRVANGQSGTAIITVTVTDNGGTANGGTNSVSKTFTITVNPLPQVNITSELGTSFSKGKTTKLTATGGVSYQWSGSAGITGNRNSNMIDVRPENASGTYTVVVTSATGCTTTQSITLTTQEDITQISGTNIISPNGDGVNDNLIIKNVDLYPNNELEVFDRAGRKVYSKKGYQNDWNASFNGIPLAEGTYYYIINFIGVGKYKGFITIIKD